MLQLARVLEVERRDAADALDENVRRRDLLAERQGRQQHQFRTRVEAVDIRAGIRFGVPEPLRFGDQVLHGIAALLHLREDVVAGAVEDAVQGRDAVARDSLAQDRMNRDAAADARFHRDVDARLNGPVPDLRTARRHDLLIRGDYGFPVFDGRVDDLRRDPAPAHEFDNDLDVGALHDLAPVRRAGDIAKARGDLPGRDRPTAHGHDVQPEPELLSDLIGVLGQDVQRGGAYIPEADDS
jgi:hypothetical protein